MIPDKMTAAVLHGPKELKVEKVDVPKPGPGEVLVEVAANGLCHTDVTYYAAQIPEKMRVYPLILGHEAAGKVAALGEGTTGLAEGDSVLLPPVYGCGECDYCQAGLDNLCRKSNMLGGTRHGAYAQYVALPAKFAFKMDPAVELERAVEGDRLYSRRFGGNVGGHLEADLASVRAKDEGRQIYRALTDARVGDDERLALPRLHSGRA